MYADPNFARLVHEDRRARFEGAATRHRLVRSLRRRRADSDTTPAPVVVPAERPSPLVVVRAAVATPGRTPGAADQAA